MVRNRKLIIALSAVVALLLAGVLLLVFLPDEPQTVSDDTQVTSTPVSYELFNIETPDAELTAVRFTPSEGTPFMVAIESEMVDFFTQYHYTLVSDEAVFDGNHVRMNSIVTSAKSLSRLTRITDYADDGQLALMGFNEPELTWEMIYDDGSSLTLELGSMLPTGDGSYVRTSDGREIYTFGLGQSLDLLMPLEELYDISYMPLPPSTEDEPSWMFITGVQLERPGEDTISVRRRTLEEFDDLHFAASQFEMTEPFGTDCNDYMVQTIFMEPITYIQPSSVIAVHPNNLSDYGLDNPAGLSASMLLTEEESLVRTLLIGGFDAELGGRYVMIEGHDAVLLDRSGNYGFLDVDPHQLRFRLIWLHMIDTVASVEFELDGAHRVLELIRDDDGLSGTLDGMVLSEDNTRRLYTAALNVIVSGSTNAPIPNTPPTYTITINLIDGGSETVELYPLNDLQYLIVYEGESTDAFITSLDLLQNLLARFDIIDAGGDIPR